MIFNINELKNIYKDANPVYYSVIAKFAEVFPEEHKVSIARAPGRVNIIGEHTDYNGLPVMPMAINREITPVFAPSENEVCEIIGVLKNYPYRKFNISENIESFESGDWGNYVKAAAQSLYEWALENQKEALPLKGFKACFGGNIPSSSGLSSSSALVVASALAIIEINKLTISKNDLADLLAHGERYVGSQGGGMDHAAILLSKESSALKIDFYPIRTTYVSLPSDFVFVIANTLVSAKKSGGAKDAYNTRVAECKLGLEMLIRIGCVDYPKLCHAAFLSDFIKQAKEDSIQYIQRLPDDGLSLQQIANFTGLSIEALKGKCLRSRDDSILNEPIDGFQVKKRCKHVITEAQRVEDASVSMQNNDAVNLGLLMNQSHQSSSLDYNASCEELDYLVDLMLKSGAIGSRMTGAGFGGCAVSLVSSEKVWELIDQIWSNYYKEYAPKRGLKVPESKDDVLFVCKSVNGAEVIQKI